MGIGNEAGVFWSCPGAVQVLQKGAKGRILQQETLFARCFATTLVGSAVTRELNHVFISLGGGEKVQIIGTREGLEKFQLQGKAIGRQRVVAEGVGVTCGHCGRFQFHGLCLLYCAACWLSYGMVRAVEGEGGNRQRRW